MGGSPSVDNNSQGHRCEEIALMGQRTKGDVLRII